MIPAGFLLLCLLTAGVYMKSSASLKEFDFQPSEDSVQNEAVLELKSRTLWKTGNYGNLKVADVEKEYFAVKGINPEDTWKLIDRDGNLLLDTEFTGILSKRCGQYFYPGDGKGGSYIDAANARLVTTEYTELRIHPSGNYLVGKTWNTQGWNPWYVVETMDGRVLYEGPEYTALTADEGFAILHRDRCSTAFDLNTGAILYKTEPGWILEDRIHGIWIVKKEEAEEWHDDILYLKDEKFEIILDGQYFRDVDISETYICGTAWMEGQEGQAKAELAQAYLHDGRPVFQAEEASSVLYLQGNVMCFYHWGGEWKPLYVNLKSVQEGGGNHVGE